MPTNGRKLMLATVLTLGFAGVEAVAGWWAGSLALLSDAGHMVTDSAALLSAAFAGWVARRGPRRGDLVYCCRPALVDGKKFKLRQAWKLTAI